MFTHILVATDGSQLADKAISCALALARSCGAQVTALMVVPDYGAVDYVTAVMQDRASAAAMREPLAAAARKQLDAALAGHDLSGLRVERLVVVGDEAHQQIVTQATNADCDLIVMASRGRSALHAAVLGSQTLRVLTDARLPVLVVK